MYKPVLLIFLIALLAVMACSATNFLQEQGVLATDNGLEIETPFLPDSAGDVAPEELPVLQPSPEPPLQQPAFPSIEGIRYALQPGTPLGTINFLHPQAGCNWTGVGGQIFDLTGQPETGLVIQVGGTFGGRDIVHVAITGSSPPLGPGGYEIALGNQPLDTNGSLWLQLFTLDGSPLSNRVLLRTYADCSRNFLLVNFSETTSLLTVNYFPFIGKQRLFYYFPYVGQP